MTKALVKFKWVGFYCLYVMTQHNEGDTVEIINEQGRNVVGEYRGIEERDYGEAHVVKEYKTENRVDAPVESEVETVVEYSVI